jgi:hypothetical protein
LPKEKVLQEIKDMHDKLGRAPKVKEVPAYIADRALAEFGSFENAVIRATGKPGGRHEWTDEELLAIIARLNIDLGRFPGWADITRHNKRCAKVIGNRWKSLDEAIRLATGISPKETILTAIEALTPPGCSECSSAEVIEEIHRYGIGITATQCGHYCYEMAQEGLITWRKGGRISTYALTTEGRKKLHSKIADSKIAKGPTV